MITVEKRLSYQKLSDLELITLYKQSEDQQVLATLYQRYSDLVFGVCLKYLKNVDDAMDAGIDIYEQLVKKVAKHEIENFKGWLHTLSRNHCLMKFRSEKNKRIVELPEDLMQIEEAVHLNSEMGKETQIKELEGCIERLNIDQRKVVELFYIQEKCYNEIVEETGIPWNTVRSQIQNARRNLKICMEEHVNKQ